MSPNTPQPAMTPEQQAQAGRDYRPPVEALYTAGRKGHAAALRGTSLTRCPHKGTTYADQLLRRAWIAGYAEARTALRAATGDPTGNWTPKTTAR